MSTDALLLDVADGIATITINRAAKRNAMSLDMWRTMSKFVTAAADDRAVLTIVLRGVDATAFAAGADIEEMLHIAGSEDEHWALMNAVRQAEHSLSNCPKPVIAMIRGICIGGGVELALGCDLRFATRNARFAIPPAKLGLVYSLSSTKRLIELVGLGRARDLLYSARLVESSEALRIGLVERVFDDIAIERETFAYARTLAERSQYSIRAAKAVSAAALAGGSDEDVTVRRIRGDAFLGEDLKEGLSAFVSKRPPRFTWR
jgi:enoyl-CoA hydratase